MPAFNTPTGMPYRYVHLQTGKTRDSINNPAEMGTLLLEFDQLSKHTGNAKYYRAAKSAIMKLYSLRSKLNLAGERINVNTGKWVSTRSHISGYIDSYFETDSVISPAYILRPENLESCFYLYRLTGQDSYMWMGKMVDDLLKHCRTPVAFASLKDVRTKEQSNSMQSFFFAETSRYAYLLFADSYEFNLNNFVFNTEAHPFKILTPLK